MAFDTGTIQTLNVLRDTLQSKQQSREAEKNRALEMLSLRLRSADAEANRLQNQQQFYANQAFQLEKSLTELTGKVPQFESMKNATGNAAAIVDQARGTVAADLNAAKASLNSIMERRDALVQELGTYFQAANVIAPEVFDPYRKAGGTKGILGESFVEGDEFDRIISDFEAQGKSFSDTQKAGLQRALNALGQQRFDNSMKEQELNLRKMNAVSASLKAQQQGVSDALDIYKDQWNQYRQFLMGSAETLGLDKEFFAKLPNVLSSAKDVSETYFAIADEYVRLAKEGKDWWRTSGEIGDILSEYDNAESIADRRKASNKLMVEFMRDPKLLTQFEFEGSFTIEDEEKLKYFQDMLRGVEILVGFEDTASQLKPEVFNMIGTGVRGLMSGTSTVADTGGVKEKPNSEIDTMELAKQFGGAIGAAFSSDRKPKDFQPKSAPDFGISVGERGKKYLDKLSNLMKKPEQLENKSTLEKAIKNAKLGNLIDEQVAKTYGSRLSSGEDPKKVAKDFALDAIGALSLLGALSTRTISPLTGGRALGSGPQYKGLPGESPGIPTGPSTVNPSARPMGAPGFPYDMPPVPQTGKELVPYSLQELIRTIRQRNLLSK